MEELNEQPAPKKVKKVVAPEYTDDQLKIIELANRGFNINQIGSMLHIHTHIIREFLDKENEKL